MKILSHKFRFIIAILMVALPLAGIGQAVAQEQTFTPEAYTSTLSGYEIEVTGPEYEITSAVLEHYSTGEGEIVGIEGQAATLEVSFFDDSDTPDESIDAYLAGLENADIEHTVVDRGIEGSTSYAIVNIQYEGVDVMYYVQVTGDVTGNVDLFESILTTAEAFETDLEAAQQEVTIDGEPFMADADGAGIVATAGVGGSDGDAVASPGADASATVVTFPNASVDLAIGGDFEPEAEPITDGSIEGFVIAGPDTVTIVALGETGTTAVDTVAQFATGLDSTYEEVNRIESDDSGDSAWSLFTVLRDGQQLVVYVYADTVTVAGYELLVAIEMPQSDVAIGIEAVQDGLTLDGQPLLADVDASEIAGLVGDTQVTETAVATEAETATATEPTTAETATATEESESGSDSPREDAKLPTDSGSGNSSETSPATNPESTPEASGDPQTGAATSWEGPLLGHVVAWDDAVWFTDLNDPDVVISDETEQFESIALITETTTEASILYIDVYGKADATPAEYLAYWTSDEYLKRETSAGEPWNAEIVATRSSDGRVAVVVSYSGSDGEYLMVREAVSTDDGGIMLLTLDAPAAEIGNAYAATTDGVTVDGQPVFGVFDQSQIEQVSGQ